MPDDQRGTVRVHGAYWVLRYRSPPDAAGRRRQQRVRVGLVKDLVTYALARAEADRVLERLVPRRLLPGASPRWSVVCDRFLDQRLPLLRRGSQAAYRTIVETHLEPAFRSYQLHEVNAPKIQEWIAAQARGGCRVASIRNRYRVLRSMVGAALREGLAANLPTRGAITFPRESRAAHTVIERGWTPAERDALVAAPGPLWRRCLFLVLASTGIRIGEALALEWRHVDRGRREINIRQSTSAGEISATKTKTSVRDIAVGDALLEMLEAYRASTQQEIGLVFPNRRGRPRTSSGIRLRHLRPLCRQLGIRDLSLHAFRHRAAADMLASGVGAADVRDVLGHSDLRMTSAYAASDATGRRQAIEAVSKLLNFSHARNPDAKQ